ncbi:NADH-ubiquinone oxidoreductase-F iron-sulfur binding region domain-containing protein [Streptomyces lutosisoli]|uniref:NADH-ubiquinone oxidoreductase-F iron-sulfur binding region domain-containing protein n=1 Tax=Streptomyces lutosisoli TaxID=2665721 RepID=A0ABW2VS70_9ACTN
MSTRRRVRIRPLTDGFPGLLLPGPASCESPPYWEGLTDYLSGGGYARRPDGAAIRALAETADLRGYGGAGFPTAVKLAAVAGSPAAERCVVANGEEGEPASVKDRYLLRHRPHLVLDGLLHAVRAVRANRAYVYVSDAASATSVRTALGQRPPEVPVHVFTVPPGYVAGESSAVVRAINGGPARPTAKPPRPYEEGVGGHPTLVQNVETLARLALLVSHGVTDTADSFLLTLSGAGSPALLTEVPYGTRLDTVVEEHLGPVRAPGVLMGGFAGGVLGPEALGLRLTRGDILHAGGMLGCGAVTVLGESDCPVAAAADIAAYFDRENAAQCGPCIKGTSAMAQDLAALADGRGSDTEVARLERLSTNLRGRGACGLLDAACATTASLLTHHSALVAAHLQAPCAGCRSTCGDGSDTRFRIPW